MKDNVSVSSLTVQVTGRLVTATAIGIVRTYRPEALKENGGALGLTEHWWRQVRREGWRSRAASSGHQHKQEEENLMHAFLIDIGVDVLDLLYDDEDAITYSIASRRSGS